MDAYHYGHGKSANGTTYPMTKNATQFDVMVDCGSTSTILPRGMPLRLPFFLYLVASPLT